MILVFFLSLYLIIIWLICFINQKFISFSFLIYKNYTINRFRSFQTHEVVLDQDFNQWLAGVIDGDGHFILSKQGSARLYIVMDIRDKAALYDILHKFGGSIRPIAGANALRYNLSNKKGLVKLIEAVNGHIRNPTRLLQLHKFCLKYDIQLIS